MRFCSVSVTEMKLSLSLEPLEEISCDLLVNPTASDSLMRDGVISYLRRYWGPESELQALYYGEGEIGRTVLSYAEGLAAERLMHAVAVDRGGLLTGKKLSEVLRSILYYSLERGVSILCIPDIDGFASPLAPERRAFITVYEVRKFILTHWPPMEEIIIWAGDPRMGIIYKYIMEHPGEMPDIDWLRAPLETEAAAGSEITKKDVLEAVIAGCRNVDEIFKELNITDSAELRSSISEIAALYVPIYQRISNVTFSCTRRGKKNPCHGG